MAGRGEPDYRDALCDERLAGNRLPPQDSLRRLGLLEDDVGLTLCSETTGPSALMCATAVSV